jgi:DNA-binding NtrC family response regulator
MLVRFLEPIAKTMNMEQAKNFKIFLVDDDAFNLNLTQHHLHELGYTNVSIFKNGTDCLNHLTEKPQIIFLDHHMEDICGFEVLKKIKRFDANIFVVMLSGQESMETAVDSLKFGAFDYIIKGDNAFNRITNVMQRITVVQEALDKAKPSVWKKIAAII